MTVEHSKKMKTANKDVKSKAKPKQEEVKKQPVKKQVEKKENQKQAAAAEEDDSKHTRKIKSPLDYKSYISKVLKRDAPDFAIKPESKRAVNNMLVDIATKIVTQCGRFLLLNKRKTLDSRTIMMSCRLLFPEAVSSECVKVLTGAVVRYTASKDPAPAKGKKKVAVSKSQRAGLIFPVSRVRNFIESIVNVERISDVSSVALASIMEYFCQSICQNASLKASEMKRTRISPRHLLLSVMEDENYRSIFGRGIFAGGVVPTLAKPKQAPPKQVEQKQTQKQPQKQAPKQAAQKQAVQKQAPKQAQAAKQQPAKQAAKKQAPKQTTATKQRARKEAKPAEEEDEEDVMSEIDIDIDA